MDTKQIFMARSAKGYDMLCVDSFLYHYENKGEYGYRWVCNKRKDKLTPCRSRIITTIIDGDESNHKVKSVFGQHTHGKCSVDEVFKVYDRKRQANLAGKPCTLKEKHSKRKLKHSIEGHQSPSIYLKKNKNSLEESNCNPNEAISSVLDKSTCENKTVLFDFEEQKTYILKTSYGRYMIFVNGFLYRLKSRDQISKIYLWDCVRRRLACEACIKSTRLNTGHHILRDNLDAYQHKHDPYSREQISELITKQNLRIVHELSENTDCGKDCLPVNTEKKRRTTGTPCLYELSHDPLSILRDNSKTISGKTKFIFLPSAKGNKVLCLKNQIFHFDSHSSNKNRTYWTCTLRRHKTYKCCARVTTQMTYDGPVIVKITGKHAHPDNSKDLKRRIYKYLFPENANNSIAATSEIWKSNSETQGNDFNNIFVKSNEAIERRISRIRTNINGTNYLFDDADSSEDSLSSFVSELDSVSEEEQDMQKLPTKLDEMRVKVPCNINQENAAEYLKNNSVKIFSNGIRSDHESYKEADFQNKEINHNFTQSTTEKSSNITILRSAKGGELLSLDGYIFYLRKTIECRTYWTCIKREDPDLNCKSYAITRKSKSGQVKLIKLYGNHSHNACNIPTKQCQSKKRKIEMLYTIRKQSVNMKLYAVSDGPPSLAVRMTLAALEIPYELINVDYIASQHMTEEYAKMNPQKEIPVLDDNGFFLPESVAIMQYLCDKYKNNSSLYPKNADERAIVNHRLYFNMNFYYSAISMHSMAPIFFDYKRNDMTLKKVKNALNVFETYLNQTATKYSAGDQLTIADFGLVSATLCLEAINFDLSPYKLIKKWYENFKQENPNLWSIANEGMQEIAHFEKNPPDLSKMNHPFHPTRKAK